MSLNLENITVVLSGRRILAPTSLTVAAGEIVGITAPSGAGKTTLLSVAGLLTRPTSGSVVINGTEIPTDRKVTKIPAELRQIVSLLPQNPRGYSDPRLTLAETICAPISFRDRKSRPMPSHYRDLLAGWCEQGHLPKSLLDRRPAEVSDGQLQRALLARAISLEPAVLLCDEPTSALDPKTTSAVFSLLSERATAAASIVIASHDQKSLSATCDRVLRLAQLQQPAAD